MKACGGGGGNESSSRDHLQDFFFPIYTLYIKTFHVEGTG